MWILAMNAFIADVTANPNDLAFRYGMLHLATSLGRPVAAPVGAYLFQTGGYVCVFSTSLCGTALGAAFLFWRIRSFKWNPPKKEGTFRTISKSAFSLSHISDCIKTTFKKREGPNRKYILICMVMILMNVFVYIDRNSKRDFIRRGDHSSVYMFLNHLSIYRNHAITMTDLFSC